MSDRLNFYSCVYSIYLDSPLFFCMFTYLYFDLVKILAPPLLLRCLACNIEPRNATIIMLNWSSIFLHNSYHAPCCYKILEYTKDQCQIGKIWGNKQLPECILNMYRSSSCELHESSYCNLVRFDRLLNN